MSKFTEMNYATIDWDYDTKEFGYHSMEELFESNGAEKIYRIHGCYINTKGKYGAQSVFIADQFFINGPKSMVAKVEKIRQDDEMIELIKKGKVGVKINSYMSKSGTTCYDLKFVDIE